MANTECKWLLLRTYVAMSDIFVSYGETLQYDNFEYVFELLHCSPISFFAQKTCKIV